MWARYSSAQFEQGAGRHACNNPYADEVDNEVFKEMSVSKIWQISYQNFKNLINPSFAGVEEKEDMDAIMARTHLIVITDNSISETKTSHDFVFKTSTSIKVCYCTTVPKKSGLGIAAAMFEGIDGLRSSATLCEWRR